MRSRGLVVAVVPSLLLLLVAPCLFLVPLPGAHGQGVQHIVTNMTEALPFGGNVNAVFDISVVDLDDDADLDVFVSMVGADSAAVCNPGTQSAPLLFLLKNPHDGGDVGDVWMGSTVVNDTTCQVAVGAGGYNTILEAFMYIDESDSVSMYTLTLYSSGSYDINADELSYGTPDGSYGFVSGATLSTSGVPNNDEWEGDLPSGTNPLGNFSSSEIFDQTDAVICMDAHVNGTHINFVVGGQDTASIMQMGIMSVPLDGMNTTPTVFSHMSNFSGQCDDLDYYASARWLDLDDGEGLSAFACASLCNGAGSPNSGGMTRYYSNGTFEDWDGWNGGLLNGMAGQDMAAIRLTDGEPKHLVGIVGRGKGVLGLGPTTCSLLVSPSPGWKVSLNADTVDDLPCIWELIPANFTGPENQTFVGWNKDAVFYFDIVPQMSIGGATDVMKAFGNATYITTYEGEDPRGIQAVEVVDVDGDGLDDVIIAGAWGVQLALTKPVTSAPTTASPTTASPTTPAPSTGSPTSPAPTTGAPTDAPTTGAPTDAPTTASPTTGAPTTGTPTTGAPTTTPTNAPVTASPATASPTTATTSSPTLAPSAIPCKGVSPATNATCVNGQWVVPQDFTVPDDPAPDPISSVSIQGNLTSPSGSTISVVVSSDRPLFEVSGCASIEGSVQVVFDEDPSTNAIDGQTSVTLVSSAQGCVDGEFSSVGVTTNFDGDDCTSVDAGDQSNAGGQLSASFTVRDSCGGKKLSTGVLVAIALGSVALITLLVVLLVKLARKRQMDRALEMSRRISSRGSERDVQMIRSSIRRSSSNVSLSDRI